MATDRPASRSAAPDSEPDPPAGPPAEREGLPEPPHPDFAEYAAEAVPAAAVGSPGKDGRLELRFATDGDGETNLVRDRARAPFHLSGTLGHDPLPRAETVFVQSPTGGVAQGDRQRVTVAARPGAVAHVTTASSTKVLSMTHNYATADVSLSVDDGAHLDYVPEPTIVHADARFYQQTELRISPSGSAIVGDVVVPGRLARGERFEFDCYRSRFRARSEGTLLVDDGTSLDPSRTDPAAPGLLDEYAVFGTLYVISMDTDPSGLSDRLHGALGERPELEENAELRAGATALPNEAGVAVRAVGHRAEIVTDALRAVWDDARTALLGVGAPDSRRP